MWWVSFTWISPHVSVLYTSCVNLLCKYHFSMVNREVILVEKCLLHNSCARDKRHGVDPTWDSCDGTHHVGPIHVSWILYNSCTTVVQESCPDSCTTLFTILFTQLSHNHDLLVGLMHVDKWILPCIDPTNICWLCGNCVKGLWNNHFLVNRPICLV